MAGKHGRPLLPSRARQMSSAEAAWVGAMIEAEGCVNLPLDGHKVRVTVCNTDVEVISTLLRFTGAGRVHLDREASAGRNKTTWSWTLTPIRDVLVLAPQVIPWMTDKGEKLATQLPALQERARHA